MPRGSHGAGDAWADERCVLEVVSHVPRPRGQRGQRGQVRGEPSWSHGLFTGCLQGVYRVSAGCLTGRSCLTPWLCSSVMYAPTSWESWFRGMGMRMRMRMRMGSQLPVLVELLPSGVNNTRVVVHVSQLNG